MAEQESDTAKKPDGAPRFRSPPYPAINLAKAVERVGQLYPKSLHHFVPVAVLADAWDYEEKSSGLSATIAALKQFGFMVDQAAPGGRRFQLSESALRIARDPNPTSNARLAALKAAALAPKVHAELWEQYGVAGTNGAMDVALKSRLMVDRVDNGEAPFSEKAAEQLIEEYKATIAYAGLTSTGFEVSDAERIKGASEVVDSAETLDRSKGGTPKPKEEVPIQQPAGTRKTVFALGAGDATLIFPSDLDATDLDELEGYLLQFLKNAKRRMSAAAQKTFDAVDEALSGKDKPN